MKNPPHPGLSVLHDCLEPSDLSVAEGARKLGVSQKELFEIVNCRSGISKDMAIRLDRAFGGGAGTWLRLQETYDSIQAAESPALAQADTGMEKGLIKRTTLVLCALLVGGLTLSADAADLAGHERLAELLQLWKETAAHGAGTQSR